MNPETPLDNFQKFAQQTLEDTKQLLREMFIAFRDTAFPEAKRTNLDYDTVCLIEEEFRTQEEICTNLLTTSFNLFDESNKNWLTRYDWALKAYTKMAVVTMDAFMTELRGHDFTYPWNNIPAYLFEKMLYEAHVHHDVYLQRQEVRVQTLSAVFDKTITKLLLERTDIEGGFRKAIDTVIDVDLPASHKRIEAIITQHYLQSVADIHQAN